MPISLLSTAVRTAMVYYWIHSSLYKGTELLSLPVHCLLPAPFYPLSTVQCPVPTVHYILYCQLFICTAHHLLPTVYCPLFTVHYLLPTTYCPPLNAHCLLPTFYGPLLNVYCSLPTVHCPLSSAYSPLSTACCPLCILYICYIFSSVSFLNKAQMWVQLIGSRQWAGNSWQ